MHHVNAVIIGSSTNNGHHMMVTLLSKMKPKHNITFVLLLPSPPSPLITASSIFAPYIQSGKIRIVEGDVNDLEALKKCWKDAEGKNVKVDLVLAGGLSASELTGIELTSGTGWWNSTGSTAAAIPLFTHLKTLPKKETPPVLCISFVPSNDNVEPAKLPFGLETIWNSFLPSPAVALTEKDSWSLAGNTSTDSFCTEKAATAQQAEVFEPLVDDLHSVIFEVIKVHTSSFSIDDPEASTTSYTYKVKCRARWW